MRVIFIYGKKVAIILTMVAFMMVIFLLERGFHDQLKLASLREVNIHKFTRYTDDDKRITYELPEKWKNNETERNMGKVIYHSNFYDKHNSIGGYIQLFEKKGNLQDVVNPSTQKDEKMEEYNYRPIKVNGNEGYLVKYKIESRDKDSKIKFIKYYIEGKSDRVVATFYLNETTYNDDMEKIFEAITDTIKLN